MVFSGRIDNSNNPLGAGMEVDVLNLNGLLVASPIWPNLRAGAQCRPDAWGRLSFLALSSCMIFSGCIDNPNHPGCWSVSPLWPQAVHRVRQAA